MFPKQSSQLSFLAALCDFAACFIRGEVMNSGAGGFDSGMSELVCGVSKYGFHSGV